MSQVRMKNHLLELLAIPFGKKQVGARGQIAVFAALIFQVLFVFFAMVVNVGLLVHHKINLQNSVDLAAYYGAMKQAEVMNAVSHINYQIRQSWKLMTYRYRGHGMVANRADNPPTNFDSETINPVGETDTPMSCPASFCANNKLYEFMNPTENYCKNLCGATRITLPGNPFGASAIAGLVAPYLPGITGAIDALSVNARDTISEQCKQKSVLSWYQLGRYIFAYKNDVQNRKRVLNKLANSISYDEKDFKDLDGESAKKGIFNTLFKNLTYQNQASFNPSTMGPAASDAGSFEVYNSLGHSECRGVDGDESLPPKWLSEIFVKPLYGFLDGSCDGGDYVEFKIRILNVNGNNRPQYWSGRIDPAVLEVIENFVRDPENFSAAEARLFHTTLGYEKNPWCMGYVRVKASTKPKIPFSPFSGVQLSATGYAKPFGGKVGPWYYKTWPRAADKSTGGPLEQIDRVLPPRVLPNEQPAEVNDDYYRVDHSRYVGDVVGAKSNLTNSRWHMAMYKKHGNTAPPPLRRMSLLWWNHLLDLTSDLNNNEFHGDILAWDQDLDAPAPTRDLEVEAIVPDQFDLTYYSVEPDFWRNYALRLQKRKEFQQLHVRGDLGYRKKAAAPWDTFTVKDQMTRAMTTRNLDYGKLTYFAGQGTAPVTAFSELLTSWHMKAPGDYPLVDSRFGKCPSDGVIQGAPHETNKAAPGNCVTGGRVGYSVKLIDEQFLKAEQELGGAGVTGRIKNLPPQ